MIIVRNKKTGVVLGIDSVSEPDPYTRQGRFCVFAHDVNKRLYRLDLAEILEDYEFVKEVL